MKVSPIIQAEPHKPSQNAGWLFGLMFSWKWEDVFKRRKPATNEHTKKEG